MENHTPCISKATSANKRNHSGRLPPKKNQLNCCVIAVSAAVVPVEVNIILCKCCTYIVLYYLPLAQLVLGLEYTLLYNVSSRCAKGTFGSEHEMFESFASERFAFDTIYYYRGAA